MPPFRDITGEEHGNLIVLGLSDHKYPGTGQTKLLWRVQCKLCGAVKDLTATSFRHNTSCGCAKPAKKFRTCVICGKQFQASPSDKEVCCSRACGVEYKRRRGTLGGHAWSLNAKLRRKADPDVQTRMGTLAENGHKAAMAIPEGQRGPQNRESLLWILIDPQGGYHKAVGLKDWARKNRMLFFGPSVPEDVAVQRIAHGFYAIASYMRGTSSSNGRAVTSYYGWRLAELPHEPSETDKSYDNAL